MKRKILYNHPADGSQRLVNAVSVSSDSEVIWDEKVDGLFPADKVSKVGWLKRSGNTLVQDSVKKAEYDAVKQTIIDENLTKQTLRDKLLAGTATNRQIQAILARFA